MRLLGTLLICAVFLSANIAVADPPAKSKPRGAAPKTTVKKAKRPPIPAGDFTPMLRLLGDALDTGNYTQALNVSRLLQQIIEKKAQAQVEASTASEFRAKKPAEEATYEGMTESSRDILDHQHIRGIVKNQTNRTLKFVQIKFMCYDSDDNQVDTVSDTMTDLQPGAEWKFEVVATSSRAAYLKFLKVSTSPLD